MINRTVCIIPSIPADDKCYVCMTEEEKSRSAISSPAEKESLESKAE